MAVLPQKSQRASTIINNIAVIPEAYLDILWVLRAAHAKG